MATHPRSGWPPCRLDPRNGFGTALKAFSLHEDDIPGPIRLLVVGGGPLRRYYEFRVRRNGPIRFVGPIHAERPGYYAHCDIYLCPTTLAAFGITLLEAMGCGTPIVCSDLPA